MSAEPQPTEQERSLYRRHRPRNFADVVGQEPVVRTLRNAVQREKVHHAYLFVGSRGTGKTSMAKILAACLNCEQGPTIEPCGSCDSCRSIAAATSLDVIEMDAASNNSVDDIRELRESVAYAPVSGRRKIYILDEAHMLSTAAWNAFLKTLEEPPPNTVFVLATTEANKVPATVIDRCHRFDFHRPTVTQISSVLARVADAEGIEIPPPALAAVARSATGSFRDALGTLEQLVTYSGSVIALDDVLAVLGVADSRLLAAAVDAVAEGDPKGALGTLEACLEQGRDAASFATDLESRARELMIVQTLGAVPAELSLTPEADAALAEQAARVPHVSVLRLLELLGEALEAVRAGADARTRLELALIKAARPAADPSLRALLGRIERLEEERTTRAVSTQSAVTPAPPGPPAHHEPPPPASGASPQAPVIAAATADGALPVERSTAPGTSPQAAVIDAAPAQETATATAIEEAPAQSAEATTLDSLIELWPAVVEVVRGENALLGALIAEARPVELSGGELTLAFGSPFLKKKAEDPANRVIVAEALRAITAGRWRLAYELREDLPERRPGAHEEQSEEGWLARFMEEFDAEELPGEWGRPEGAAAGGSEQAQTVNGKEKGA